MRSLVAVYDAGIMAGQFAPELFPVLDLADEGMWEELLEDGTIECISLEEAGLEEDGDGPVFGGFNSGVERLGGGVLEYTAWLMDGELNLEEN